MKRCLVAFAGLAMTLFGCGEGDFDQSSDDLTSATGEQRQISWQGYVYVGAGASDDVVRDVMRRQVKSALGALRKPEIGLQSREAEGALSTSLVRESVTTIDTLHPGAPTIAIERIKYTYTDTAVVRKKDPSKTIELPLLFGDYAPRAGEYAPCTDDPKGSPDSLWYHFAPHLAACKTAMKAEIDTLNAEAQKLTQPEKEITKVELDKHYLSVRAELAPVTAPPPKYPEYDRLFGFGTDRTMVVTYAFFGVDGDIRDSHDVSLVEQMRFFRTLRKAFPKLSVTYTSPYASLLDFTVDGKAISVTYEQIFDWIVDDKGYPAAVGSSAAKKEALRQQVIDRFAEHWIYWDLPVRVSRGGETRDITLEVRSYWGYEDGVSGAREAARNRYLEAFWHGDVFLYQGHSHFGHGPLEPSGYGKQNFPTDRYQTMLVNSCLSFNYYDVDFLAMHPSGSKNLDVVVNGLPAYWTKLGEASAGYVIGLLDGKNRTWGDILQGMVVKPSGSSAGYDPLRVVNGELDNTFDPAKGSITLVPR